MKLQHSFQFILFCFINCMLALPASSQIWEENFDSYAPGTFNATKWTSYATDCDDLSINEPGESMWGVYNGEFTINDIEGDPCCVAFGGGGNDNAWQSEVISLVGFCDITISMDVAADGPFECNDPGAPIYGCQGNTPPDNSHDQVEALYNLDGTGWIQFGYGCGNGVGPMIVTGLNGTNLEIRFTAACKSNFETYTVDNILVEGMVGPTPTFALIGPLCDNEPPYTLPTISLEGIPGTWDVGPTFDPAGLGGTTVTIEFTPDPSTCSPSVTIDIEVEIYATPVPQGYGPFCETDPPFILETVLGGDPGTWTGPGVSNNIFDPSVGGVGAYFLFWTPDPGLCASGFGLLVEVNPSSPPVLGTATVCETDPPYDLTQLENPPTTGGVWSGPGVTANMFDPMGQSGPVVLTYTPVSLCTTVGTTIITVDLPVTPTLLPTNVCETSGLFDLNAILDPLYQFGTWTGPGVTGSFFNPTGLPGPNTLTFTSSDPCVSPADVIVTVDVPGFPTLGMATVCQTSGLFDLTTLEDASFPNGAWVGINVSGNMFDPTGLAGPIPITYQPIQPCTQTATTEITVELPATPDLDEATICESSGLFNLTTIQDPMFPLGDWTGPGVTGTTFNPIGQNGPVGLIFNPTFGCGTTATTIITVEVAAAPQLDSATLCETDPIFDLTTIQDPGFPLGDWSGTGVTGTSFDPDGLMGTIPLTFLAPGNCVLPATTNILVNVPVTPSLGTATLCETEGLYNLSNIADPNYPAGTWTGDGVMGNNFDPDGLSGNIPLTFTPSANCTAEATTTIIVNEPASPNLDSTSLCQNSTPLNLTTLNDPAFPNGNWSGPNVTSNMFDPAGQSGTVVLTFTPTAACSQASTSNISVNLAPTFSNQDETCDPATQMFTVSFDIGGGAAPYTVDGSAVTGNSFTSMTLASGTNYSFQLNDANGCGPITISGSANCNCSTDAGTMDFTNTPILLCQGSDIDVAHLADQFLDGNDNFVFILHTNAGTQLGTVLSTSTTTTIPYPSPSLTLGQTYYISAVAGDNNGSGGVDLTDGCLSVAQGVPVSFYLSEIVLNQLDTMCAEDCFDFTGTVLNGVAPFDFAIAVISGTSFIEDTIYNSGSNFSYNLCPVDLSINQGIVDFGIEIIGEANGCFTNESWSTFMYVNQSTKANLNQTLCAEESIVINGKTYDSNNPIGTETFPNGSINGCDSIVDIDLSFFPSDTNFIIQTLCTGSSIIVNGKTYDESNSSGIEIVAAGNMNGCDSIIFVDLDFNNQVIGNLQPTICPSDSVIVNGKVYNASNPVGSETFQNGSVQGCDSTVLINLSFYQPATANLMPELCPGGSIIINGKTYDEDNPSGTDIIPNASINSCDSVINVNVIFTNEVNFILTPILCPGGSIVVNGNTYDADTPVGEEVFLNGSFLGCDSVVTIALGFHNGSSSQIKDQLCFGGSIIVNGNVYDEASPIGVEVVSNGSMNGCDSTIVIDLSFSDAVFETVGPMLCPGGSVIVNGQVYDEDTPFGTEVILNGSLQGCDSTILVDLSFGDEVFETIDPMLCSGQFVEVNGQIYNENNPSGIDTIPNGSYLGCDSIIIIDLEYGGEITVDYIETLCPGGSVIINGTVYDEDNEDGQEILQTVAGCDSIIDVAIDFYLPSQGTLEEEICSGSSIIINGTVYDEDNPSGSEVLQAANIYGCDSTLSIDLSFTDQVVFELDETLCPGGSITVNGTVYDENNPSGTEIITGGSVLGCDSLIDVNLSFYLDASGTVTDTLTGSGSIIVNGTVYDENNPSGTEIISNGSIFGCDSTVFINLFFESSVITVDYETNSTSCEFGSDGSIVLVSIDGGQAPYTIALNGSNSEVIAVFPHIIDNLENGFYTLTIVDATGAVHTEEIFLPFPDPPLFDLGDDIFLDLGESVTLIPDLDFTPASYFWEPDTYLDCSNCGMPVSMPFTDIAYSLTVTDENGCTFSDDVNIFVQKARNVYGPTAFSPNNDANNDEFTLFTGGQVEQINSLLIFDRWGDLLFEQYLFEPNNLSIGWDGRFKGKMMNPGVYVWFAEVAFLDGEVGLYEGEVTLIR